MKAVTAAALAALLVTLGACGGSDDDKPQQPTPEVPVTPQPQPQPPVTPEPNPPVTPEPEPPAPAEPIPSKPFAYDRADPFWRSFWSETLASNYEHASEYERRILSFVVPFTATEYSVRPDDQGPFVPVSASCSFDPGGLIGDDKTVPAKVTFGDIEVTDPTITKPDEMYSRWAGRNQFYPELAGIHAFTKDLKAFHIEVFTYPESNSYMLSVTAPGPDGVPHRCKSGDIPWGM